MPYFPHPSPVHLRSWWHGTMQKLETLVMARKSHTPGPGVRETDGGSGRRWNSCRSSCLIPTKGVSKVVIKYVSVKMVAASPPPSKSHPRSSLVTRSTRKHTGNGILFFKKYLYWSIIALQWCVSFCFITKWISYTYSYIPISLPSCVSLPPTLPIPPL